MKYTKYGKNRYIFLILDEKENVVSKMNENISNKNVIDRMHKLGIANCNRHYGDSYDGHLMRVWASGRKENLNKNGYGLFNSSGYLARFNDNRNNIKVKYVVIDMIQKDKHLLNVSRFYNATQR
jgi:hypothetical protein|tara:strand:+ start:5816 stop:6187 length:372 start_codon:yes stop_codon:yes gene_type:complete